LSHEHAAKRAKKPWTFAPSVGEGSGRWLFRYSIMKQLSFLGRGLMALLLLAFASVAAQAQTSSVGIP
jgi:hypothetical protein